MAYSSKWEMTILEIQTRDIHTPTPTPPPHTCPTLRQTYAWLCLISHCIFCSLFIYFCAEFSCINFSEHWTTLPPFIQEQTCQVSWFWGQSDGFTRRYKNLTVSRFTSQWNKLIEYFHFYLEKVIFMNQLCRNPQFSGIFISICHIWSSCWHDKC